MIPFDSPAIDVHGHFGTWRSGPRHLLDELMHRDVDVVVRRARSVGIEKTIVSGTPAFEKPEPDPLGANDEALEAAEKHPDIHFWVVLNPRIEATWRQAEEMLRHPKCAGIKIHPRENGYEISERGDEIFAFAAERNTVILTHSGNEGSLPKDFVPFADRYPTARLILGHLGNDDAFEVVSTQVDAILASKANNIFTDTSSTCSMFSGLIEYAVETIGVTRILFGTDTPVYSVAAHKGRIVGAEIDDDDKRAILHDNAAALFGF